MTTSVGEQQGGAQLVLSGAQMLFVAFGALVLMPLLTGMDPNVALFTAGVGTLIFQLITGRQVPVFLASSFAFIAPIIVSTQNWGMAATLGGLAAAGVLYMLLSVVIKVRGTGFLHRVLPPVVVGPVIMVIGLGLAPVAVNMALGKTGDGAVQLVPQDVAMTISFASLLITLLVATMGRGILKLVPIMVGVVSGYVLSVMFGIVDFAKVSEAAWFALPNFVTPEWNWNAVLFMIPVAIAPAIEHVGDVLAIGNVTGKDYIKKPGLHRTMLGDGVATTAAAMVGGPPNTTYSEVTGAVMLTKAFNPKIMTWAALFAVGLAFIGKVGVLLQTIPVPVMGGILMLLFGSIAVVGLNTLIKAQVDMAKARNLAIVSLVLVTGIGGMSIGTESFSMQGVGLCALVAVVLNLILPHEKGEDRYEGVEIEPRND
ncbi:uracil-xanthine permease family protein [Aestuariirhabdus sp. Z084]|uniref:uracil-xanthine permease family protein n=1 Tax=Aestuariirhabdus haliotis TaxID=2918751 RepID=UPI00201B44CC|nr:uracil-xanthine permease family protein [Aestuariirhabdus haliotis]MCL6415207.1 uracil-xanthine permease family protein [Aestuariirhabdus haliotis]MCL6419467.1 uracil-xanthine permease family protein [Aestuariirhabdus haliotis]